MDKPSAWSQMRIQSILGLHHVYNDASRYIDSVCGAAAHPERWQMHRMQSPNNVLAQETDIFSVYFATLQCMGKVLSPSWRVVPLTHASKSIQHVPRASRARDGWLRTNDCHPGSLTVNHATCQARSYAEDAGVHADTTDVYRQVDMDCNVNRFTPAFQSHPHSPSLSALHLLPIHAMFCKATLLTVALALLASANPVAREPAPAAGLRIPLHRPRSLKDSDGVFDHARAVQEIVKTKK